MKHLPEAERRVWCGGKGRRGHAINGQGGVEERRIPRPDDLALLLS
jgi:hypothetical protein